MPEVHPFLVHFPIALLLASVVFDVWARFSRNESMSQSAFYCLVGGLAGGVLAVFSGFRQADEMRARILDRIPPDRAQQMLSAVSTHQTVALFTLGLFAVLLIWRIKNGNVAVARSLPAYLVVAVLGAAMVLDTGYLGGKMAHGRREGFRPGNGAAAASMRNGGGMGGDVGGTDGGMRGAGRGGDMGGTDGGMRGGFRDGGGARASEAAADAPADR